MQAFEYANPATVQEAVGLLGARWGEVDVLAGGTDLLSLMKEHIDTPRRVVNIKNIKELGGIQKHGRRCASAPRSPSTNWSENPEIRRDFPVLAQAARGRLQPADPPHGNRGRRPLPAAALLVLPQRLRPAGPG